MMEKTEFNKKVIKVIDMLDVMFNNIANLERRVKINVIKGILFTLTF